MDREQIKQEIKQRIPCADYLEKSKSYSAHNQTGYCCPSCNSGKGQNGTGAVKYYPDTNTWYCHACDKGGDVIDAYQLRNGCDYKTAVSYLAAQLGLTIDRARAVQSDENRLKDKYIDEQVKAASTGAEAPTQADFTAYYNACCDRIENPAAVSYLEARGISIDTAYRFFLGYDPAADPAGAPGATGDEYKAHPTPRIIIPCTKDFYIARSTDPSTPGAFKAPNPKGTHTQLFNAASLYGSADVVFITEGVFDALSFIEAGQEAIATNGKGNGKMLLQQLQERPTKAALVIVPDNDDDPKTAADTMKRAEELNRRLRAMDICSIVYNVAGEYHDANDAIINNRSAFEAAIEAARAALLPGLLTPAAAKKILEDADDEYLTLPRFEQFSLMAKLKRHDTIVIAADTGAGKSSLALNFLYDLQDRYPALYINLEMDEATILQRLISIHTGIDLDRIEGYKHDPQTRADVDAALNQIISRKEIQLLTDAYDLETIEDQIKLATHGRREPTIVFIDTALLVTTGSKTTSRYERFTHISEELRRISRLNNVIMFVLLQQSREGKSDEKKRPTNSSLKESGSWENDATKITFLWYNPTTRQKELVITKNRNGRSGIIELNYSPHTQTYSEGRDSLRGFIRDDNAPDFEDDTQFVMTL